MPIWTRREKEEGLGWGVVTEPTDISLPTIHVIEGADELSVLLPDDREYKARLIGADPKTDVAVIKIEAENLPTVTLADSDKLRVGDVVFAVGNPLGVGQTVTMGIVSGERPQQARLARQRARLRRVSSRPMRQSTSGNSGGALIDAAKGRSWSGSIAPSLNHPRQHRHRVCHSRESCRLDHAQPD